MSGDTSPESGGTPESEAREEAEWELITAHTLRARGDFEGAASWFRRAVEHLMDAGDDDRALEVARLAADMRTQPPPAIVAPPASVPPAPQSPAPAPVAPAVEAPAAVVEAPVVQPLIDEPSIVVAPDSSPPGVLPAAPSPQPFMIAPSIRPMEPASVPAPIASIPAPAHVNVPAPIASIPVPEPVAAVVPVVPARRTLSYTSERAAQSDQLAAQLPALPVFTEMPIESLRAIARQVTVMRFAPGDVLVEGGSSDGPMLVLTEGTARVSAAHQKNALDTAGAGDIVGELAAYHGGVQVTTVVAESAGSAVAFAPSLVRALAREYPAFRAVLEEVISDRAYAALPGNAGLLRSMASAARESVYALFEPVRMREGDALFSEGIAPSAVWLVAAGEVEVYGGDLGPRGLTRALAGTALCVGPVLSNEPCGVSARALRDVLVARIGAASFRGLAAQYPEIGHAMADIGVAGRGIAC